MISETARLQTGGVSSDLRIVIEPAKAEHHAFLQTRLEELAAKRMHFGYRRLTSLLLREGNGSQPICVQAFIV